MNGKFYNNPNRPKHKRYYIKRVKIGNYNAKYEFISMTKRPGMIPRKFTSWKHCIDVMRVLKELDKMEGGNHE